MRSTKVWFWVLASVYYACINPGGYNYVSIVPVMRDAIEPMIENYKDHYQPIQINNRWNVQDREGLIKTANKVNGNWASSNYCPGENLEAWWKGMLPNGRNGNNIDFTSEEALDAIHCQYDIEGNIVPGTGHTLREFYHILQTELDKIGEEDPARRKV